MNSNMFCAQKLWKFTPSDSNSISKCMHIISNLIHVTPPHSVSHSVHYWRVTLLTCVTFKGSSFLLITLVCMKLSKSNRLHYIKIKITNEKLWGRIFQPAQRANESGTPEFLISGAPFNCRNKRTKIHHMLVFWRSPRSKNLRPSIARKFSK